MLKRVGNPKQLNPKETTDDNSNNNNNNDGHKLHSSQWQKYFEAHLLVCRVVRSNSHQYKQTKNATANNKKS